jgi:hypothetical protein
MAMPSNLNAAQKRLSNAQARKRRAALGPPLRLDDATLYAVSYVGPGDQPETEAYARAVSGRLSVEMLEAR